ncbi:myb/sant-like dna-binding domain [Holotrichia oblita]|uniref:Myb/sant-like dna-binding domain n=1 Tax=Holotrichia oblita TaxID=644536 RepID=A0ACB9SJT0_HOLOL|nr:myb/sant-like dna-binding domain [Holotrichia oblita]
MFENIANDMISSGHSVNAQQVHLKWKSLLRSYKACKDNKSKTGRSPSRFHFFDQIDAIVGDKPSNSCEHTLESSEEATITATNSEQLSQMVSSDEDNSSKDLQAKKSRKRKRSSQAADLKELIEMKREEYKKRQERFDRKCIIEEKKIELLNKLINEVHS